jgi:hypothetical protein
MPASNTPTPLQADNVTGTSTPLRPDRIDSLGTGADPETGVLALVRARGISANDGEGIGTTSPAEVFEALGAFVPARTPEAAAAVAPATAR